MGDDREAETVSTCPYGCAHREPYGWVTAVECPDKCAGPPSPASVFWKDPSLADDPAVKALGAALRQGHYSPAQET